MTRRDAGRRCAAPPGRTASAPATPGVVSRMCGGSTRWRARCAAPVSPVRSSTRMPRPISASGAAEVAPDVGGQRLQRRDVEGVQARGRRRAELDRGSAGSPPASCRRRSARSAASPDRRRARAAPSWCGCGAQPRAANQPAKGSGSGGGGRSGGMGRDFRTGAAPRHAGSGAAGGRAGLRPTGRRGARIPARGGSRSARTCRDSESRRQRYAGVQPKPILAVKTGEDGGFRLVVAYFHAAMRAPALVVPPSSPIPPPPGARQGWRRGSGRCGCRRRGRSPPGCRWRRWCRRRRRLRGRCR